MKRRILILTFILMICGFWACQEKVTFEVDSFQENLIQLDQTSGDIIPGQYVVVFKKNTTNLKSATNLSYQEKNLKMESISKEMLKQNTINPDKLELNYSTALEGFSVRLEINEVLKLKQDKQVDYIVPDRMFIMKPPWAGGGEDEPEGQVTPVGITRVGSADGTGKVAWIIDTGVDFEHPDLNVDLSRAKTFVRSKTAEDDHGHGTHVAGIIGAKNNDIGVIGVAYNATIVPVKVLDRRGSGSYSSVLAGIDYVAANASAGDVANLSLGGNPYQPIDDAIYETSQKGIYFSIAAGNKSEDANDYSPARVNGTNIFTVSAMDDNDQWAYFSNFGNPPVDFCAPGINVNSTWKEGRYKSISGTSMAAPHVAGILLIKVGNPSSDGYVIGDPDNNPDPIVHQ
jgi:hypothetical protein